MNNAKTLTFLKLSTLFLLLFSGNLFAQSGNVVLVNGERTGLIGYSDFIHNTRENISSGAFYLEQGQTIIINLKEVNGNKISFNLTDGTKLKKVSEIVNHEITAAKSGMYYYSIDEGFWGNTKYTLKIELKNPNSIVLGTPLYLPYKKQLSYTDDNKAMYKSSETEYREGDFRFFYSAFNKIDTSRAMTIFAEKVNAKTTNVLFGHLCAFYYREYFTFYAGDTILINYKTLDGKKTSSMRLVKREADIPVYEEVSDGKEYDRSFIAIVVKETSNYYVEFENRNLKDCDIWFRVRRIPGSPENKDKNYRPKTVYKRVNDNAGECCCDRLFGVLMPTSQPTNNQQNTSTQVKTSSQPTSTPTSTTPKDTKPVSTTTPVSTSSSNNTTPASTNTTSSPSGFTTYSTKSDEKLEAMKKDAVAKSDFDAAAAIKTELDLRKAEQEKVANFQKELDEKVKAEDYAGASKLQKEIGPFKEKVAKKDQLRKDIDAAVASQDYEKAEKLKQELKALY